MSALALNRSADNVRVRALLYAACADSNVEPTRVLQHRRSDHDATLVCHVAMYLARELTQASLPTIAREFRYNDHTTVMYACKKIERRMTLEPEFAAEVGALKKIVQAALSVPVVPLRERAP